MEASAANAQRDNARPARSLDPTLVSAWRLLSQDCNRTAADRRADDRAVSKESWAFFRRKTLVRPSWYASLLSDAKASINEAQPFRSPFNKGGPSAA
jgi:hypothetical protein